jgi:preprotein translocase SecE subunit
MPFVNKLISFIKESYAELKAARWPTKQETIRLTTSLIVISAGMGLFVTVFDYIFKEVLAILVK